MVKRELYHRLKNHCLKRFRSNSSPLPFLESVALDISEYKISWTMTLRYIDFRQPIDIPRDLSGVLHSMLDSGSIGIRFREYKGLFEGIPSIALYLSIIFCNTQHVFFMCSFVYKLFGESAKLNASLADNEKDQLSKLSLREVRAALAAQAVRPPSTGVFLYDVGGKSHLVRFVAVSCTNCNWIRNPKFS